LMNRRGIATAPATCQQCERHPEFCWSFDYWFYKFMLFSSILYMNYIFYWKEVGMIVLNYTLYKSKSPL
jgi:hypothetical protein